MARPRDEMRAAGSAMLLRCQLAREASRRLDAARATRECDAANSRLQLRRTALADGAADAHREIASLRCAMQVAPLDQGSFDRLLSRETAALARVRVLERDVDMAIAGVEAARDRLAVANAVLLGERRATCKRQRLADTTSAIWRLACEVARDAEGEDQFTDTWRPE